MSQGSSQFNANIRKYGGTVTSLGQKVMASSIPVTFASDASTLPVSVASLPLPAGAATSALQSTQDTSINSLLKPASTLAAVTTVGSVTAITNALPTGANVIGQVTANAGTNLNTSALALDATLTGGTAKAIARGGAKGTAVAADITSNPVDANTQALHVNLAGVNSTVPVTGTFFQATQPVSAASLPLPAGAATEATLAARIPVNGQALMAASVPVTLASNQSALPVTLTSTTITGTVTADTELPVAAALADATANPTTPLVGSALEIFNGTTWDRARGDIANGLDVDVTRLPALVAGAAIVGKVGIDQTTPGTTNATSIAQIGATTVATGVGASSAGTQRVVTATDSTIGTVTTLTGTTTLTPGTAATNLGKAVDNVAGATDTGVASLVIRDDALTTLTPIDGKYVNERANARGASWVAIEDGLGGQVGTTAAGTAVNGLNTVSNGTVFSFSTLNSTTAQLAQGATYTGAVESVVSQQSFSVLAFSDQSGQLTIKQFTDAAGTKLNQTLLFDVTASVGLARSGALNGNYVQVTFKNTGPATTTTLQIDTAFGTIPSATQYNNNPVSLQEVNGTPFTLGQKASALSLPVTLPSDMPRIGVAGETLEEMLLELRAIAAALGTGTEGNKNTRRRLDEVGREVVSIANTHDNIKTTTTTISASTVETSFVIGGTGADNRLLALIVSNTSAATNTRIDIRDATAGPVRFSLQSIGGANPVGFSLGGVAIPQQTRGGDWTATCATSTTDVRIFAIYSIN